MPWPYSESLFEIEQLLCPIWKLDGFSSFKNGAQMTAIAEILTSQALDLGKVINTSATDAFDTTFSPDGFSAPGVARWVDRTGGIAEGYPAFTLSVRPPQKGSQVYKVMAKLTVPTLEVTSPSTETGYQPAPKMAYANSVVLEFMLPARGTREERIVLLSHLLSLLATNIEASDGAPSTATGTPMQAAILDFEPAY